MSTCLPNLTSRYAVLVPLYAFEVRYPHPAEQLSADASQQVLVYFDIFPQTAFDWIVEDAQNRSVFKIQAEKLPTPAARSLKVLNINRHNKMYDVLRFDLHNSKRGMGCCRLLMSDQSTARAVAVALPPMRITSSKTKDVERLSLFFNYAVVPEDGIVMFLPNYKYTQAQKVRLPLAWPAAV